MSPQPPGSHRRHRVVMIGAGFGGLAVVKGLRDQPVDVVLVDAHNFHTFQPLLYQVATAGLDVDDVAYAIRGIFRRQRNVEVRMARVTRIDADARVVYADAGPPIEYDTLVVGAGAVSTSYGVPGVDEHAFALKSAADAVAMRQHVIGRFEAAATDPSLASTGALDVVVCGGGPTGVELAGGMMELFTKVLTPDFPELDVARARVVLVEAGDRLLSAFSEASSDHAREGLTRVGVEVLTGVGVAEVTPAEVVLVDGRRIATHTVAWAAGVRPSDCRVVGGRARAWRPHPGGTGSVRARPTGGVRDR
ncbi:MAG: FAD-dependent oxidoreductase [Ilumatobacteraceae bacterium]